MRCAVLPAVLLSAQLCSGGASGDCPPAFIEAKNKFLSGGDSDNPFPNEQAGTFGTAAGPAGATLQSAKDRCQQATDCLGFCFRRGDGGDEDISKGVFFYKNKQLFDSNDFISYSANDDYNPSCGGPDGPGGAGAGTKKDGESGCPGGCVFLILFFVGGFTYFAAGAAINYKRYEKRGVEMVPHLAFWKDLPLLVKDGAFFAKKKLQGENYTAV